MAPLLFALTLALCIALYLFNRSSSDPILSSLVLAITLPVAIVSVVLVVAASTILYYIFASKILNPSPNYQSSSFIDQVRQLQLPVPYPDAFDLCRNSLSSLKNTVLLFEDRRNGIIEACVLPSLLRYGVRISYHLTSQNNITHITLNVKNPVPWILIDNGITKRRADTLTTYLQQHSSTPTLPQLVQ
jgi:hypothetical protein